MFSLFLNYKHVLLNRLVVFLVHFLVDFLQQILRLRLGKLVEIFCVPIPGHERLENLLNILKLSINSLENLQVHLEVRVNKLVEFGIRVDFEGSCYVPEQLVAIVQKLIIRSF